MRACVLACTRRGHPTRQPIGAQCCLHARTHARTGNGTRNARRRYMPRLLWNKTRRGVAQMRPYKGMGGLYASACAREKRQICQRASRAASARVPVAGGERTEAPCPFVFASMRLRSIDALVGIGVCSTGTEKMSGEWIPFTSVAMTLSLTRIKMLKLRVVFHLYLRLYHFIRLCVGIEHVLDHNRRCQTLYRIELLYDNMGSSKDSFLIFIYIVNNRIHPVNLGVGFPGSRIPSYLECIRADSDFTNMKPSTRVRACVSSSSIEMSIRRAQFESRSWFSLSTASRHRLGGI